MAFGRGLKIVSITFNSAHSSTGSLFTDNFDEYWKVASKVTPTTTPARPHSPSPNTGSLHARPPSTDPTGAADRDGAYNVRSVPVRIYLADGPVLQDLCPPNTDGRGRGLRKRISAGI